MTSDKKEEIKERKEDMKKIYLIPEVEVVKVETAMMLADSGEKFSLFRTESASTSENNGEFEYENAL